MVHVVYQRRPNIPAFSGHSFTRFPPCSCSVVCVCRFMKYDDADDSTIIDFFCVCCFAIVFLAQTTVYRARSAHQPGPIHAVCGGQPLMVEGKTAPRPAFRHTDTEFLLDAPCKNGPAEWNRREG